MRTILLASLVFSAALVACAQTVVLTPQSIAEWNLTGADGNALIHDSKLALPSGAQVDRMVGAGIVFLRAVTHPTFSAEAGEQPAMGVGPASIAFARNESDGQFLLVVGESTLVDLPWRVSIAPEDQSVELTLGYDPHTGVGLVGWQGRWEAFAGTKGADPVEVWLAAGTQHIWPLDSVEVFVVPADQLTDTNGPSTATAETRISPGLRALLQQLRESLDATSVPVRQSDEHADSARRAKEEVPDFAPRRTVGLEVFTPPSVRRQGESGEHARNNENL